MKIVALCLMASSLAAFAVTEENPYEVESIEIYRVSEEGEELVMQDKIKAKVTRSQYPESYDEVARLNGGDLPGPKPAPTKNTPRRPGPKADPIRRTGEIIGLGDRIVALGERIYNLVNKGRPSADFNYAPISIIPRVNDAGKAASVLNDMSAGSMPKVETYNLELKNGYGSTVVDFEFNLIFFYGLKFKGVGDYITGAQIVPKEVNVDYGYDFNATMKLSGIVNHGSDEYPMAGGILVLEYNYKNMWSAKKRSEIFHIMGDGKVFNY